jgi:hypothetical protein
MVAHVILLERPEVRVPEPSPVPDELGEVDEPWLRYPDNTLSVLPGRHPGPSVTVKRLCVLSLGAFGSRPGGREHAVTL